MARKLGTRKVDELGRIVLLSEARQALGIGERQSMDIYLEADSIILKVNNELPCCKLCGQSEVAFNKIGTSLICDECVAKVKDI